ncbi:hypothetical protein [Tautonia sociabilis]|uniref:Four helix bundle protein n=1 Tax=Tautonia sociabilis TaxID=2080755 RepID=A0A432MCI4_9BACT|nr:hypothetical protein [Tautonia sociabilis]RUL81765.1 hypothetical protein TsocGM_24545 [Tautonia sociabilis]
MFIESRPADPRVHEAAIRIARRCRHVIQCLLREEEWAEADREFYRVAREELEAFRTTTCDDRGR